MANDQMMTQMSSKPGFIAALDQSGGSTPGALRLYGIPDSDYKGDDARMYELVHEMRVRIITAPAFTGDKVIAAILFERTMDGEAKGKPVPSYLWEDRGVVPDRQGRQGPGRGEGRRQPDEADAGPRQAAWTARASSACSAPRCARSSTWRRKPASPPSPGSSSSSASRSRATGSLPSSSRKSRSRAPTRPAPSGSCSTN